MSAAFLEFGSATLVGANTNHDGTGANAATALAAREETEYVKEVRFQSLGTNAATAARIWLNNGGDRDIAKNNRLLAELTLAATTSTETAGLDAEIATIEEWIPAGYRLHATIGTAGTAGWHVLTVGGENYVP